jgi:hypothetical protein
LPVGVRLDQAGVNRKAFAANQTLTDAALQDRFKNAPQEIASRKRPCRFFEKVE